MVSQVTTVEKAVIKRGWRDVEPKVYAAFASGLVAALALMALHYAGAPVTAVELVGIPWLTSVIAGYIKASTHKGGLAQTFEQDGLTELKQLTDIAKDIPAVAPIADGIAQVEQLLQSPTPLADVTAVLPAAAADAPAVSTGTLQVTSA